MGRIDTRWFTETLRDRGISQRSLAKMMRVDPSSVHRMLTGKRPVRLDEVVELATLLEQPIAEILVRVGVPVRLA